MTNSLSNPPHFSNVQIGLLGLITLLVSGWALTTIVNSAHNTAFQQQQSGTQQSYTHLLAENHQQVLQSLKIAAEKDQLTKDFAAFQTDPSKARQVKVEQIFQQYSTLQRSWRVIRQLSLIHRSLQTSTQTGVQKYLRRTLTV